MSYRVNNHLLFIDLTDTEAKELGAFCERLVVEGHTDIEHPAFVAWCKAANFDERQVLLVYSTAFPQRALLSLYLRHTLGESSGLADDRATNLTA